MKIHRYAHRGDIAGVQQELDRGVSIDLFDIEADFVNANLCFKGMTPLQCALASPLAGADMVKFLYDRGAKRSIDRFQTGEIRPALGNVLSQHRENSVAVGSRCRY